jgi:hypothetical protein
MNKFQVNMDELNTLVNMGVLSIMILAAVLALYSYGMGVIQ